MDEGSGVLWACGFELNHIAEGEKDYICAEGTIDGIVIFFSLFIIVVVVVIVIIVVVALDTLD